MSITVIMTAFNVEKYVSEAIESVLNDDILSELIVIDDASSDKTWSVINGVQHPKIVKLKNRSNLGLAKSRNVALSMTSSDWVTFLDADDFYLPGRLHALFSAAISANLDMVADNVLNFPDGNFRAKVEMHRNLNIRYNTVISLAEYIRQYSTTVPLIRTRFLKEQGLLFPEDRSRLEDFEFWVSCFLKGARFAWIQTPYYCYRGFRPGSLSQDQFIIAERELNSLNFLEKMTKNTEDINALRYRRKYVHDKVAIMHFKTEFAHKDILALVKAIVNNTAVRKYIYTKLTKRVN